MVGRCRGRPAELDVRIMECLSKKDMSVADLADNLREDRVLIRGRILKLKQEGHVIVSHEKYINKNYVKFWTIKNQL